MKPVRYVADVSPVLEVALWGAADGDYWRDYLSPRGCIPRLADGRARLTLGAMRARFRGVRFREWTLAVVIDPPAADEGEAFYLVQGFTTVRLFAWAERTLFSTPYQYGQIDVEGLPAAFQLSVAGSEVCSAAMTDEAHPRAALSDRFESWQGAIALPSKGKSAAPGGKFYALLEGQTQVYPFLPGDVWRIADATTMPFLETLRESHFAPGQWAVRLTARHARSKTFPPSAING